MERLILENHYGLNASTEAIPSRHENTALCTEGFQFYGQGYNNNNKK